MTSPANISKPVPISTTLPLPEAHLSSRDGKLNELISTSTVRWPTQATEHPIWGLLRIIIAQQVSTAAACRIADKFAVLCPSLVNVTSSLKLDLGALRSLGLPEHRAQCCVTVGRRSGEILSNVSQGHTWEQALGGIKGIGPWTIAVFRIMVLRDPDVLPLGDVGLERAVRNVYGRPRNVERLGEKWRPFRSVACWYLWRTLGNEQLG